MTHKYKINGMHCEACAGKIKSRLLKIKEIESADVTLSPPQAIITMSHHINTDELNSVVKEAGKYSLEEEHTSHTSNSTESLNPFAVQEEKITISSYKPLILIFAYLLGFVILSEVNRGSFNLMMFMNHFMGGFFLIFSFFKFLNLSGFANAYSTYDIIAKKWRGYGFIYPFIELALGISYLYGTFPKTTNVITLLVMGISSIGVIQSVLKKNKIQCACLGTVFNLPMTTVTIVEDLLMVVMAAVMLILL